MKENKVLYNIVKGICSVILRILYWPKVYGKKNIPKEGSFILAGNHKHAYDPVLAMINTKRIIHYFAKEEVSGGFHGFIMRKIGTIIVYKDRNKNVTSVMEAEKILKNGGVIGIFPEGTRNRTDKPIQKFKTGTVNMAQKTNTIIVPFAIRGTFKIFKKGLEIEYGKPLDVSNIEVEEANDLLKNEVLKLLKNNMSKETVPLAESRKI